MSRGPARGERLPVALHAIRAHGVLGVPEKGLPRLQKLQGLGTHAEKYSARMVERSGERWLELLYAGVPGDAWPIATRKHERPAGAEAPHAAPRPRSEPGGALPPAGETHFPA